MGVHGLTTYLQRDSRNFEDFKLHNMPIVIDALNFANYTYFSSSLHSQFNGEYAGYFNLIFKFIAILKRCNVVPIFVFDGCHIPSKLQTQLKRAKQRLPTIKNLVSAMVARLDGDVSGDQFKTTILPPLAVTQLAETLRLLEISYVTSDRESDQDAVSLAIYLNCPVLSNDSDFFITIPNLTTTNDRCCFIPLSSLSFSVIQSTSSCSTCMHLSNNKGCLFLQCKRFLPSGPGFNNLPSKQKPLFASLLGNDYIPSNKLLKLFPSFYVPGELLTKKLVENFERRKKFIKHVIQWLKGFGDDEKEPISRLLSRVPKTERSDIYCCLLSSLNSYKTNPDLIYSLFSNYITSNFKSNVYSDENLFEDCSIDIDPVVFEENPLGIELEVDDYVIEVDHQEALDSISKNDFPELFKSKNSDNKNEIQQYFDVTNPWSANILKSYRLYSFNPTYMDSLYSSGVVLNSAIESLNDSKSIHRSSVAFRCLFYGIMLGMELTNSKSPQNTKRLAGLQQNDSVYYVSEFDRTCSLHGKMFKLCIKPIQLNETNRSDFMNKVFGFNILSGDMIECWLKLASLICVIQNKSNSDSGDITHSTVPLIFGAIVTSSLLLLSRTSSNCDQMKCLKNLEKHSNKYSIHFAKVVDSSQKRRKFSIHFIQCFAELQLIYNIVNTLFNLVDCLTNELTFPNIHSTKHFSCVILFQSGRLFHALCCLLDSVKSVDRQTYVYNVILPYLLSDNNVNASLIEYGKDIFRRYLVVLYNTNESFQTNTTAHYGTPSISSAWARGPKPDNNNNNNNSKNVFHRNSTKKKVVKLKSRTAIDIDKTVDEIMLNLNLTD